jgi:hypothetical protein
MAGNGYQRPLKDAGRVIDSGRLSGYPTKVSGLVGHASGRSRPYHLCRRRSGSPE